MNPHTPFPENGAESDELTSLFSYVSQSMNDISTTKLFHIFEILLDKPIILTDMSQRVLYSSDSVRDTRPDVYQSNGLLCDAIAKQLLPTQYTASDPSPDFAVQIAASPEFGNLFYCHLHLANFETVTLLALHGTEPVEASDVTHFQKISKLIYYRISNSVSTQNVAQLFSGFWVNDVLDRAPLSPEDAQILEEEHFAKRPFYLLLILHNAVEYNNLDLLGLLRKLNAFLPSESSTIYHSKVAALLTQEQYTKLYEQQNEEFQSFLSQNSLICAIGPECDNLTEIEEIYKLTQTLLCIMPCYNKILANWREMQFHIMVHLIRRNCNVYAFVHPAVIKLHRYDAQNNQNLLETLAVYLENRFSPDIAARQLYISRSSLFFRLRKIREIADLNFDDIQEMYLVYFSIMLFRIQNEI